MMKLHVYRNDIFTKYITGNANEKPSNIPDVDSGPICQDGQLDAVSSPADSRFIIGFRGGFSPFFILSNTEHCPCLLNA